MRKLFTLIIGIKYICIGIGTIYSREDAEIKTGLAIQEGAISGYSPLLKISEENVEGVVVGGGGWVSLF